MLFSEKLVFIMELTASSNKNLASALQVDPSMISRLRQGRRKAPHRKEYIRSMAAYFARKISSDYQRAALAETIGQRQLRLILKTDVLAQILYDWLVDEETDSTGKKIDSFIRELDTFTVTASPSATVPEAAPGYPKHGCYTYFGNEGRRSAFRVFLSIISSLDNPCDLLVASDENQEWITENSSFSAELSGTIKDVADRGFFINRISPPMRELSEALSSFSRWLPAYMTGNVVSYYYPRLRDNLFHRTIIAAPGVAAISSTSVGDMVDSDITYLYLDPEVANAISREFTAYKGKCIPMAVVHSNEGEHNPFSEVMLRCEGYLGNRTRKNINLPWASLPAGALSRICRNNNDALDSLTMVGLLFEESLTRDICTDIIFLPAIDDLLAGNVPISLSNFISDRPLYYTPGEFRSHLLRLLELMTEYPDYTVLIDSEEQSNVSFFTIEGTVCLLFCSQSPCKIFEISEPLMVASTQDYINSIVESGGEKMDIRRKTMERLRSYISQLDQVQRG